MDIVRRLLQESSWPRARAVAIAAAAIAATVSGCGSTPVVPSPPTAAVVAASPDASAGAPPSPVPSLGPTPTAPIKGGAVIATYRVDACSLLTPVDAQHLMRRFHPALPTGTAGLDNAPSLWRCGYPIFRANWKPGPGSGATAVTLGVDPRAGAEAATRQLEEALSHATKGSMSAVAGLGDRAVIARGYVGRNDTIFRRDCCGNSFMDGEEGAAIYVRDGDAFLSITATTWPAWATGSWSATDHGARELPTDDELRAAARTALSRLR